MTAIAVLAVLVALAVPNFNDATLSARLNGFANSLVASRPGGPQRGDQAQRDDQTLCVRQRRPAATAWRWEQGWIVVTDDDTCCSTSRPCRRSSRSPGGGDTLN